MEDSKLQKIPNEKYEKFFGKFSEIAELDPSKWNKTHLLGYFTNKYKTKYNTDYSWKFNNPAPSKCFEVWQMSVLLVKLSSDPVDIKNYIDWVFENKLSQLKRRFTSISFITNETLINDYKMNVLFAMNKPVIKRTTILPESYKNVFKNISQINTYGDLCFLNLTKTSSVEMQRAFENIKMLGFDETILEKII